MTDELTPRQLEVLQMVDEWVTEYGFPPTLREIAAHIGAGSTTGAAKHLDALERKLCLTRQAKTARGIKLTAHGRKQARQ